VDLRLMTALYDRPNIAGASSSCHLCKWKLVQFFKRLCL